MGTASETCKIADEFCSHALIDQTDGSRVRVIEASKDWPVEQVRPRTVNRLSAVTADITT
jgi:hypothetical protein